ncbi:fasciclin arabinogalactan protein [Trifolium repens]|nr:fasciclin arabinogalactan protein [Trifolium repens]
MLIAAYQFKDSGIDTEFDTCSGITVFVPCDNTFYNPRSVISQFASLSKQNESMVMKYHVIRGYYPPTPFPSSISKPTLATEMMGLGNFLLKISKANDSVTVSTDIVKAKVTRIVFDKSPIGIYVVSKVYITA